MAWSKSTRIIIMLVIDIAFFIIELGVGVTVGSLALMADAFHMLNDVISLVVGLWAVKAAQKASSDKYSFGWLRAEILGAFFNAVFLIALCLSIILEALTRFIHIPTVKQPKLILIVGSLGLASNIVGFFVLGGHGHSHGPEEHDHDHHGHTHDDEVRTAEEGQSGAVDIVASDVADEDGAVRDILPEVAAARVSRPSRRSTDSHRDRQIKFTSSDETASTSKGSDASASLNKFNKSPRLRRHGVRSNSITSRLASDINIHPASFRQEIIEASRNSLDDIQSADDLDSPSSTSPPPELTDPTEHSPLRGKHSDGLKSSGDSNYTYHAIRQDSWHVGHHHNKPRKHGSGGHSHNHSDMGMRAMVLHVIGDALGNVGVIVSALIIWLTDSPQRFYADPAVSLFITLIILRSAIPLTSATAKILLQATPDHLDVNDIKEDIQDIPGVVSCHHVHIWQLSDSQIIASLHIQVAFEISTHGGAERYMQVSGAVRKCLHAYGIHSATIQPEFCLDSALDHADSRTGGLDGGSTARATPVDNCLMDCVDDCVGKSCCSKSPPSTIGGGNQSANGHGHPENDSHDHSQDGHTH